MPGPWLWDDRSKRYRDTATGRYITYKRAISLRDEYVDAMQGEMDKLSRRLAEHQVNLQQWVLDMRQNVKDTFVNEYMLARGGRHNMTQSDWGRVGAMLRTQYGYINRFAGDIDAGKLSAGQIRTRARMYVDSATQAFERAKAESQGAPQLPAYPGDGTTICLSNCRCHWEIDETDTEWHATWSLGAAEHCPTCVERAGGWNPLIIPK